MNKRESISYDYIRGLTDGEGSFTFSTNTKERRKTPSFCISMHIRDKKLLTKVRDTLGLRNRIYEYHYKGKDGYNRGPRAILIVREFGALKNIIIPLFYKNLYGNKSDQFEDWIEKIGNDPIVPEQFKFLHQLYKSGFYEKENKYQEASVG